MYIYIQLMGAYLMDDNTLMIIFVLNWYNEW